MAGKTNYKTMPLAELEELAANHAATSKRLSPALKAALNAARADAMHEAAAAAAPAPEPEVDGQADADAQDAAGEPEPVGVTVDIPAELVEAVAEVGPRPVLTDENELCGGCDQMRAECGGHEITDDAVAEADAKARRKAFTTAFARLLDGGFNEAQAGEALAGEFPDEVAEYQAMHSLDARTVSSTVGGQTYPHDHSGYADMDEARGNCPACLLEDGNGEAAALAAGPPQRDPLDVDMATGEVRVDRPATGPVPPSGSFARVEATPYPVTFYRPVLKIISPDPDDPTKEIVEEIVCSHVEKYGHGSEKAAISCARSMAYQRGLRVQG